MTEYLVAPAPGSRGFEVVRADGVSGFRRLGSSKATQPKRVEKSWGFAAVLKSRKQERAAAQACNPPQVDTTVYYGVQAQPAEQKKCSISPQVEADRPRAAPPASKEPPRSIVRRSAEPSRTACWSADSDASISPTAEAELEPPRPEQALPGQLSETLASSHSMTYKQAEAGAPQGRAQVACNSLPKLRYEQGAGAQAFRQGPGRPFTDCQSAPRVPRSKAGALLSTGVVTAATRSPPGSGLASLRDRLKASLATSSAMPGNSASAHGAAAAEVPERAAPGDAELQWGSEKMRRKLEHDRALLSKATKDMASWHPSASDMQHQQPSALVPPSSAAVILQGQPRDGTVHASGEYRAPTAAECTSRAADIARRWGAKLPGDIKHREGSICPEPNEQAHSIFIFAWPFALRRPLLNLNLINIVSHGRQWGSIARLPDEGRRTGRRVHGCRE